MEGSETKLNEAETPTESPGKVDVVVVERNLEEDVIKLNEERWPNVNGVYDAQGEWHDWNDITYNYSYDNSELTILPYTVCIINLHGDRYVTEEPSNN